jgi:nucleotide-binding universal stress UspA family protein
MTPPAADRDKPVIICYDGSREAADAITFAAGLVPGARAVVITAWKPIIEELLAGPPESPPISDPVEANERQKRTAATLARDGAKRASAAGLDAEPLVVRATGALWEAIEEAAEELDARLIVCGTSRSGVKTALPGNLASSLVQHASLPVLVVPSAKAAAERRRALEKERRAHVRT